jgi:uncharacterized protein (DUF2164 family)
MAAPKLIHDPQRINAALKTLPDGRVIALGNVKIYSPTLYADKGISTVGLENSILGICAIVVDDTYYCVMMVTAVVPIDPIQTNRVKMDGDDYFEFVFEPGGTFIKSVDLVCHDTLVYQIFDVILAKGNVPWYLGYEELRRIFDTAKKHAGADVGGQQEVTSLIVSLISRTREDRVKYYRTAVMSSDYLRTNPPVIIPLMSARYGATNTTTKLGGSYFDQGLASALINPSERVERIEGLLLQ